MDNFIYAKTDFEKRPVRGYTYIYIYSLDNLYLYTGQTIQSIAGRYRNHLSDTDTSGAHYANNIAYFQIKSEYANYAEGYISDRLCGICQRNAPNPDYYRNDTPPEVRKILQKIGNKLTSHKSSDEVLKAGELPLYSITIKNDGSQRESLLFFSMLLKEKNIIANRYCKYDGYKESWRNDIFIKEMRYCSYPKDSDIKAYLLSRPKNDYRPCLFMKANTIANLKYIKNIVSNFPIYCVVDGATYDKYKDIIDRMFSRSLTGLIIQRYSRIDCIYDISQDFRTTYKACLKTSDNKHILGINKQIIQDCETTRYRAIPISDNYYQCA